MTTMKTIYGIAICWLLGSTPGHAQDTHTGKKQVAYQFMEAFFRQQKPASFIIDSFIYLSPADAVSLEKRKQVIAQLLDSLKTEKAHLLQSAAYEIYAYKDFTGSKKQFDEKGTDDILIITVHQRPVLYLYCTNDKIRSFTVMDKPGQAYFLTF